MKQSYLIALGLLLGALTTTAFADIVLKSKDEVAGIWKLESSKNSLTDKNPMPREDTWVFKNGQLTILHIPREGKYYDQPPVNYDIDDGKLKIALVGNSRFETYTVIEKDDKNMTLKGKFGGYYFFKK